MMKNFIPGDAVAYSRQFIRSIQAHELGHYRGRVVSVSRVNYGPHCVRVDWGDNEPRPVLAANLVHVKMIPLELY